MTRPDPTVGVAIPSIPPRTELLYRALGSVRGQTYPVDQVSIATDHRREGAAVTRQRALDGITTEYTLFLDDDDAFMPQHAEHLIRFAQESGADYAFSWFDVIGGIDPFPQHFGRQYDVNNPTHTTMTVLVRTELAKSVGFKDTPGGEDWGFTLGCIAAGAVIEHLPERTWTYFHNSGNTSGRPDRW